MKKKEINLWFTDAFQKNKKHERWTIFTWINKTTLLPNYFFLFDDWSKWDIWIRVRASYHLHSCVKLILNVPFEEFRFMEGYFYHGQFWIFRSLLHNILLVLTDLFIFPFLYFCCLQSFSSHPGRNFARWYFLIRFELMIWC